MPDRDNSPSSDITVTLLTNLGGAKNDSLTGQVTEALRRQNPPSKPLGEKSRSRGNKRPRRQSHVYRPTHGPACRH
jgi:hypothetical protein